MANNLYTVSGAPAAGSFGQSAAIRAEFGLVSAGFDKLKYSDVVFPFADLNTAGSLYLPALADGTIVSVAVIPSANNATAATVITLENAGAPVTMPTLQIASGGLAGVRVAVTPTGVTDVTRNTTILRAITDGGGSSAMPGFVIVTIERG